MLVDGNQDCFMNPQITTYYGKRHVNDTRCRLIIATIRGVWERFYPD